MIIAADGIINDIKIKVVNDVFKKLKNQPC
jgi:hypothetical protein